MDNMPELTAWGLFLAAVVLCIVAMGNCSHREYLTKAENCSKILTSPNVPEQVKFGLLQGICR